MESSTRSTEFVFCRRCGLQRVCDVAEELQILFSERQLDPNTCAICRKLLEETSNGTDVCLKLEQNKTASHKDRQSDAKDQSESDNENYALTAEESIETGDNIESEVAAIQGGASKSLLNVSVVIKKEILDDTVIVSLKGEASSEEQAEPVVKKLKGVYQKKKKVRRKKPVKNVNPAVVQAPTDEPCEAQPQRRATRLRTGALQARQYTNPQNEEFSTDEEELGDLDSETNSEESSEDELECEEKPTEKRQDDADKEEPKEELGDDEPDESMKESVQKLMLMVEDPEMLAPVKALLEEAKKQIHEFLVPELLESTEPSDDPTRPVQCKVCKQNFMSIKLFLKHLTNHTGKPPMEKPLKCTECGLTYAVTSYKNHACRRRFKHRWCIYKGCRYRFSDRSAFISHVDVHRGINRFICRKGRCGAGFNSMKDLVNHRRVHYVKQKKLNKQACRVCKEQFSKREYLRKHEREVHQLHTNTKCDECGRVFVSARHLQMHKKWHKKRPESSLFCSICTLPCEDESALDKHLKAQSCSPPELDDAVDIEAATKYLDPALLGFADTKCSKDKLLRCKFCVKTTSEFATATVFLKHMQSMHPGIDCPVTHAYHCDQCSKTYPTQGRMMKHLSAHSSIRPFKCDHEKCESAFKSSKALEKHQLTHLDRKDRAKHICHICGAALLTVGHLKYHMHTIHTSTEKPYRCSYCDIGFFSVSKMRHHEKVRHLNVRAYVCETCGKSFKERSELRTHNYTHTGEKPFACKTCDYRCTRTDYLRKHERIHTGVKPYGCDLCGMKFLDRTRLNAHARTHHKTGAESKPKSKKLLSKSGTIPETESQEMLMSQSEPTAAFVPPSAPGGTWPVHASYTSSVSTSTSNAPHTAPAQREVDLACQTIAVEFPTGVVDTMPIQSFIQMLK